MLSAPAHRSAVERMTREGFTARQISEELGITRRTVQRNRTAAGVAQPRGRPFDSVEHERILEMLEDGVSIPEIARTIGRSRDVLWRRYKGLSKGKSLCDSIELRRQLGLLLT